MAAWIVVISSLAGCGVPPLLSDTGFRGTWQRQNDRNISIVAITEVEGRWLFRWTKRSFDGKYTILCDWHGRCEERLNGALLATYAIATRYDDATGKLFTDTVEERTVPDRQTFRYTDVMEVKDAGRTLMNYTVDRDGVHYEGTERPQRSFAKVSDAIAEPPRGP